MNEKKKILALSIYPAPYRVEVINALSAEYVVTTFFESGQGDSRDASWFKEGNYYLLDTAEGKQAFAEALRELKSFDMVILYDYSTPNSRKLGLRCLIQRVPYMINSDGVMLFKHGNPVKELYKRIINSNASGCMASGEKAKEYFLSYGVKEHDIYLHPFTSLHADEIAHEPVSIEHKRMLRKELGICSDENAKVVIAVGRFIPLKMYDQLIEAWKQMPYNIKLLLVGGGAEEKKYRQIITENEITNVIIEGFHPKEELVKYYRASDLFVHPTSYDVWGLVVNEAMACGLPVVVSDKCVAGLELVNQGKNGYIFPYGDYDAMVLAIKNICDNSQLNDDMAKCAVKTINSYTIERMGECQLTAVKECLRNGKAHNKCR